MGGGKLSPELLHLAGCNGVPDQAVGEEALELVLTLCCKHKVYQKTVWTALGYDATVCERTTGKKEQLFEIVRQIPNLNYAVH
jgi:hypothetical protein